MAEDRIPLRVTYDADANAAYVYLSDPVRADGRFAANIVIESPHLAGWAVLDVDEEGRIMGLEVQNARGSLHPYVLRGPRPTDPDRTGSAKP